MKKYILISIFLLACAGIQGQITLTGFNNLDVGDTYRFDLYDAIESMNLGTTGGGNSWDFSSITGTFIEGQPVECVIPAGTPFADSSAVQGANLVTKTAGSVDGAYVYYDLTNNYQKLLANGHYESGNVSFANYYDDLMGIEFPFTYGDTYTDNYDVKIYNVTVGGYLMRDSGSVYTEADAFGSLITPAGTYSNVLRLTTTTTAFTWMNFGGVWTSTGMSSTINYDWYAEGVKIPVMTVTEFVGFTGYSAMYLVDHNFPVGMAENEEAEFDIYPNPAGEHLHIRCAEDIQQWKIYGMNGILLKEGSLAGGTKVCRLPVLQYPPGMYILEARLKQGGVVRECFIKR